MGREGPPGGPNACGIERQIVLPVPETVGTWPGKKALTRNVIGIQRLYARKNVSGLYLLP